MKESLSRRDFLRVAGVGAAAAMLGACTPEVVEKVVKETVVVKEEVEKVVKETVLVEGEEKVVTKIVEKVVTEVPPEPVEMSFLCGEF